MTKGTSLTSRQMNIIRQKERRKVRQTEKYSISKRLKDTDKNLNRKTDQDQIDLETSSRAWLQEKKNKNNKQ